MSSAAGGPLGNPPIKPSQTAIQAPRNRNHPATRVLHCPPNSRQSPAKHALSTKTIGQTDEASLVPNRHSRSLVLELLPQTRQPEADCSIGVSAGRRRLKVGTADRHRPSPCPSKSPMPKDMERGWGEAIKRRHAANKILPPQSRNTTRQRRRLPVAAQQEDRSTTTNADA